MIITANRVIHCNSDLPEEMHHWISLLQKPKGDSKIDGQEFLVRGEVELLWNYNKKNYSILKGSTCPEFLIVKYLSVFLCISQG